MNKLNKVAIFGMGQSGQAAFMLAKKQGLHPLAINQGDPQVWWKSLKLEHICELKDCYSEENLLELFSEITEIIISPGIPLYHPALVKAKDLQIPIISEIEFAYRYSNNLFVIAITGTNGKTTTTTMISEALKIFGKKVFCGGNIGHAYSLLPLFEEKVDYAVIEVSSFQLESIKNFHPSIGLILNIFPNHSERYDEFASYAAAKFRLLNNMTQNDHLILGTENPFLNEISHHPVQKHYITKGALPESFIQKFDFSKARVRGEHNEVNFYATYLTLSLLGLENLDIIFQKFINQFSGVTHRLEFVLDTNGLKIYNDAKSTNALSTITAIKAFKDSSEPLYLIIGGKLRSESDRLLPDLMPFKSSIVKIFLIGEVTERLYDELKDYFEVVRCYDIKNALEKSLKLKGHLIFSPGFPSFDQFKNYVDRGERFKALALEIFQKS